MTFLINVTYLQWVHKQKFEKKLRQPVKLSTNGQSKENMVISKGHLQATVWIKINKIQQHSTMTVLLFTELNGTYRMFKLF